MPRPRALLRFLPFVLLALGGWSAAFSWDMGTYGGGSHFYAFEVTSDSSSTGSVVRLEFDVRQTGATYSVTTSMSTSSDGVSQEGVIDAFSGGDALGMLMFGPMMLFYGPGLFILPFALGGQDVAVTSDVYVVAGMGKVRMDRTENVAGLECVVVTYEPTDDDDSGSIVFGLAEGMPFPCFSTYGGEGERTSIRLVEYR